MSFIITNICFSQNLQPKDIIKFFDFSNIRNLQLNITKLLSEQLSLPNGQNLWKAFLYLYETCNEEFTFKFTFKEHDSFGIFFYINAKMIRMIRKRKYFISR